MLREQMAAACRRFADLTGAADVAEPPLRLFVFHDRGAFVRFHQRIVAGIDLTTLDGLQLGNPYRLITLCTAPAACRITDPERTIRSLAAYVLLESAWGPTPPAWLQSGLARSVDLGGDRDELARLNRKMAASLARGTALSAEMFAMTPKDLFRLLRGPKDTRESPEGLAVPSSVLVDRRIPLRRVAPPGHAAGARAPSCGMPDRRPTRRDRFRHHFGLGFGPLLDGWRRWVLDRGIGTYEPPPDRIRDGLLERVLPAIRDRRAKRGDRLVAIGEWVNAGFVLGADALIDLLREPGDLPKEHIVWALCMVSGIAWGDEPDRWQAWWDDLPSAWDEPPEAATTPSDAEPVGPVAAVVNGPSRVDPADA